MPIDQSLAEIQKLTQRLTLERHAFLRSLPKELGFGSSDELIQELRTVFSAAGPKSPTTHTSPIAQKTHAAHPVPAAHASSRKTTGSRSMKKRAQRTQITPEIRERVVELIKQLKTANAIAAEVGISVQTVQNIKRKEKLVGKFNPPPHNKTTPPFPIPDAPVMPTKKEKATAKQGRAKKAPPAAAAL